MCGLNCAGEVASSACEVARLGRAVYLITWVRRGEGHGRGVQGRLRMDQPRGAVRGAAMWMLETGTSVGTKASSAWP